MMETDDGKQNGREFFSSDFSIVYRVFISYHLFSICCRLLISQHPIYAHGLLVGRWVSLLVLFTLNHARLNDLYCLSINKLFGSQLIVH